MATGIIQPAPTRRCAICGIEFSSPAQYMGNRGELICRARKACLEREHAERSAAASERNRKTWARRRGGDR